MVPDTLRADNIKSECVMGWLEPILLVRLDVQGSHTWVVDFYLA